MTWMSQEDAKQTFFLSESANSSFTFSLARSRRNHILTLTRVEHLDHEACLPISSNLFNVQIGALKLHHEKPTKLR